MLSVSFGFGIPGFEFPSEGGVAESRGGPTSYRKDYGLCIPKPFEGAADGYSCLP